MTIEFKIPNGSMRINADTFFKEAPRMKIRKMLKCFRDSEPAAEDVHKIKDWLQEKADLNKVVNAKLAKRYRSILEDACKIFN